MKTFLAALAFVLCCLTSTAARAAESYDQVMTQSDGIVGGIVDNLWSATDAYFHHGDYPRIIGLDRIITQADPQFVECYSTGGWLMDSLGRTSDAEAFYQEACRNNPDSSPAFYSLGMFYYSTLHDYGAAVAVYQQDTASPTADINDWKMLAHSYERLKELDRAVATWRAIKKRWPNGPAVQTNLNRVLALQHSTTGASL